MSLAFNTVIQDGFKAYQSSDDEVIIIEVAISFVRTSDISKDDSPHSKNGQDDTDRDDGNAAAIENLSITHDW